jgi:hypothetical protein
MKNDLWLADPRFLKDIKRHERKWKTVSYDVQNVLLALSADDRMIHYLGKAMPGVPVGSGIWENRIAKFSRKRHPIRFSNDDFGNVPTIGLLGTLPQIPARTCRSSAFSD